MTEYDSKCGLAVSSVEVPDGQEISRELGKGDLAAGAPRCQPYKLLHCIQVTYIAQKHDTHKSGLSFTYASLWRQENTLILTVYPI